MTIFRKIKNSFRGLQQRYGTGRAKERLWDKEYSRGRWGCLEQMAGDPVYEHVEKHSRKGSILDLGCGPGATGNELNAASYETYTGVEISQVAIEKARTRTEQCGRTAASRYVQSDLYSYVPDCHHDVILFGDSLYYVPPRRVRPMLVRYAAYLKAGGVFIVRSWVLSRRHRSIVEIIERNFEIVGKQVHHYEQGTLVVLVFQAQRASAARTA